LLESKLALKSKALRKSGNCEQTTTVGEGRNKEKTLVSVIKKRGGSAKGHLKGGKLEEEGERFFIDFSLGANHKIDHTASKGGFIEGPALKEKQGYLQE